MRKGHDDNQDEDDEGEAFHTPTSNLLLFVV